MKNVLYILGASIFMYLLFACYQALRAFATVPAHDIEVNSKDIFDCFSEENFEITYKYVHWKHRTSKKLSPNHRVIVEGNVDVEAAEDEQGKYLKFWKNNELYCKVDAKKGVIPIFKMQKESYVQACQELFCDLLEKAKFKSLPKNYTYHYADGSGNLWKITANQVEYIPVKPENSSSGTYSGGEPFEVSITLTQFQEIEKRMLDALQDTVTHQAERSMGTGAFSQLVSNALVKRCYVGYQSPHSIAIEKHLKSLKP